MTPPTYSPWLKALELFGRFGFGGSRPYGSPGIGDGGGGDYDVVGSLDWRRYLDGRLLYEAWSPHATSPWSGYARPTLFAALDARTVIRPQAAWLPTSAAARGRAEIPDSTAVLLDLPGPLSVVYGAWLCRMKGMQPVALFNNWPHPKGVVPMGPVLGALLYYLPWVLTDRRERSAPDVGRHAPPVFMADRVRLGALPKTGQFDNRYFHLESDLPSAAALKRAGIERLVYVRPGVGPDPRPPEPDWDLPDARLGHPEDAPVEMPDLNPYLRELRKSVGVFVARADVDAWTLGDVKEFAPGPRKTPFNTTKDPAFSGFRRASVGGFGRMLPEAGGYGGAGYGYGGFG